MKQNALICLVGIAGVLAIVAILRRRKNVNTGEKKIIQMSSDTLAAEGSNGHRDILECRLDEYLKKATAYYLQMSLRSSGASIEKIREIEDIFGRELAMPVLELSDLHALPVVGSHIGEWATSFLKSKGIDRQPGQSEWVWLKRSLSSHARQEAARLFNKEMP